ncbi:hypothetical protein [Frankia gtarii]|uniref:hypothetical protein n=1 Tax=Frankia gtarii TaxID=2950102 RepID=UPI0021C13D89|nr:hypothetical protein [Frankia gtarii]
MVTPECPPFERIQLRFHRRSFSSVAAQLTIRAKIVSGGTAVPLCVAVPSGMGVIRIMLIQQP